MSNQNQSKRTRTEVNRENARQSTGPKDTALTKFNAVRHGLLAAGVTEMDGPESFADFCAKIEAELKPVGEVETFLARRIVLNMVRLQRAALLEAEFITAQLNPPTTKTTTSDMGKLLAEMNDNVEVLDPGLPARLSPEDVDSLCNSYGRYETATENRMIRALHELERRQRLRRGEKVPAPASVDIAVHGDNEPLASFGNPPRPQEEGES